jgi:hypothetical protein
MRGVGHQPPDAPVLQAALPEGDHLRGEVNSDNTYPLRQTRGFRRKIACPCAYIQEAAMRRESKAPDGLPPPDSVLTECHQMVKQGVSSGNAPKHLSDAGLMALVVHRLSFRIPGPFSS